MGSGGVAIAALPTVICLKVPFSDGLGGGALVSARLCRLPEQEVYQPSKNGLPAWEI